VRNNVEIIWKDVLKGNSNAWQKLVAMYTPLVLSVARRAGMMPADAEDCAQLAWVALYKSRHDIRHPERIPGWLTRVTARKVLHMSRQRIVSQQGSPQAQPHGYRKLPDEELLDLERDLQLETALQQLDPQCRRVLVAFFYGGANKSYRDIARELQISQNSLGPTRMRCLRKLKKILIKTGYPWMLFP
jgi:RNA polymerase sigma factor (sigma-70 family)